MMSVATIGDIVRVPEIAEIDDEIDPGPEIAVTMTATGEIERETAGE